MAQKAYLVLENGKIFEGRYFGVQKDIIGEVVFSTNMGGYLETLTDKSYFGQIVVQTFPLVGNYGVIEKQFESDRVYMSAYVVRHLCDYPSNFQSEGKLEDYFVKNNLTGIYGIDTRALTKIIRNFGEMNGIICSEPNSADLKKVKEYRAADAVMQVSTKVQYIEKPKKVKFPVAVIDLGLNKKVKNELLRRGLELHIFPADTDIKKILDIKPRGVFLTNGPGNPADNAQVVKVVKELISYQMPIMGVGLGHQIIAIAFGFKNEKLKHGHRGANQSVKNVLTNWLYVTNQNHSYAVLKKSIDKRIANEYFININDNTNEGIEYKYHPVFSLQFDPETDRGPNDTGFLFDRFVSSMEGSNAVK